MILMHRFVLDMQAFNETHFCIFQDDERQQLLRLWKESQRGEFPIVTFLECLSPLQKNKVVRWGVERSSYTMTEIIPALEKFIKCLKKAKKSYNNVL